MGPLIMAATIPLMLKFLAFQAKVRRRRSTQDAIACPASHMRAGLVPRLGRAD